MRFHLAHFRSTSHGLLQSCEEGDEQGDAEIDDEAVEDGDDDQVFAAGAGDDGESGVHSGGAAHRDGCQLAKPPHHQWSAKQGDDFAHNIRQQRYGAQLGALILGDEHARERVVAHSRTHSEAVAERAVWE